ncbi:MAG: exo-alpha-sialidase [Anaerolineae bacterium]|nr:exo-alpha-sialidase [Anaerolineae bacterium]
MKRFLSTVALILGSTLLLLTALLVYWYLRPNRAEIDPVIIQESWDVVNDHLHNSNTDMISWQGYFYLAYVSSPFHFASDASVLHVVRSTDAKNWESLAEFNPPGEDIRDPKFAIVGEKLFLYALKNTNFIAEPYITVFSFSTDGRNWTAFETIPNMDGWLFWRPRTQDGVVHYNAAYWYEHGKSILIKSTDGIHWDIVSTIYEGDRNDETEVIFLPDGRLLATARLEKGSGEGVFGHPEGSTLIAVAQPPYTQWKGIESKIARLDGPYLFIHNNQVYALGRFQPNLGRSGPLTDQGSILARKRTSLYQVREDGLIYLSDLPSAGDTSYVGLVVQGNTAYASYYTSRIDRDYPWILGMLSPSAIRMAKIDLIAMEKKAKASTP